MPESDAPLSNVPPEGSLGLLAYGWRGVVAWRAARGTVWREELRREVGGGRTEADPTHEPDPAALAGAALVVVSGLPRTGTSMMMQMLTAGGLPAFTDEARAADASNPRGYYEHARVKGLARDRAWVPEADGHVVKVVAPLLPFLPPGARYRVVMMERDLDEVLASQAAMLTASGHTPAPPDVLRAVYAQRLAAARAWADETPGAERLSIPYADAIADPAGVARRVAAFVGGLDPAPMAAAVDRSLHRQRA
ncbi:sulfotransferase family protein [Rubrivirga sp. IMCC45206]|uniref:sulfotransferase family protein n=1 Tax=Rubrivirga sp. IMCC45206 TaxID=3391614 RepID=UPI00398FC38F